MTRGDQGGRFTKPNWLLLGLVMFFVAGFLALGVWQLERRVEKLALIDRVESRVNAPPVSPPDRADWPQVTASRDEYRHVRISGHFAHDRETLVQAVTEAGAGSWVLTPLVSDAGFTVLVNRGFVPPDRRDPATRSAGLVPGEVVVTGLLRISEPRGGFLRSNDPVGNRWFSRDVEAIAAARGLSDVAPYFIDADATPNPGGWPLGGLTVVHFANNHLVYALTWFALGLGLAAGVFRAMRGR